MQNEARFEFVLVEGGDNPPGGGGTPERSGLEETNRLLQKILEAQGFRRLGGDGAEQQPRKPVSAEDLASIPVDTTRSVDLPGPTISNESRSVIVPPAPRITLPEPVTPPPAPQRVEQPSPILPKPREVETSPGKPPEASVSRTEPERPPELTPTKPDTSLEDMHQKFRDETKAMTDKLMDDLVGARRRERDARRGIIQAESAPIPKAPEPVILAETVPTKAPEPAAQPSVDITPPSATPEPVDEDPLERSRREWDDLQNNFARKWADEKRQKSDAARERMGLPPRPTPGEVPAVPAELPSVPPPAMVTIPRAIPAIGGAAISGATVAAASGVAAGVVGVAAIAKANYELLQSMDTLAKRLAPTLVDYSPEVAAAQAAAELREVMRTFSTSDRLGETVGRLVEANSVIKDSMTQLRDVVAGPIMADAATIKEGLAGLLSSVTQFVENNQGTYDAIYHAATRYLPGPQNMIGQLAAVGEILKKVTGYEEKTKDFDQMFMNDGMITPPGWDNASEVNVPMSFANPGVELP